MADFDLEDLRRRMEGAIKVLNQEFGGLRTGRADLCLDVGVLGCVYGDLIHSVYRSMAAG